MFGSSAEKSAKKAENEWNRQVDRLCEALKTADAVVIGAGAGLSTAAGFTYGGERFRRYFSDFEKTYGFHDMYSGGFYPYETFGEHWAYWSRYIYVNRYMDPPKPVYSQLYDLVKNKDYFVLTTNVDHCFQKAGFDKHRLFYTQGDYGLFQCSKPCTQETTENADTVKKMLLDQGFSFAENGTLLLPEDGGLKMCISADLIPLCPHCGRQMAMNLRADDTFAEDEGWHEAAERYSVFIRRHKGMRILFLELGVGYNTPGIIKYPFWQMTFANHKSVYACLNMGEAAAPTEIAGQSVCINEDIAKTIGRLADIL